MLRPTTPAFKVTEIRHQSQDLGIHFPPRGDALGCVFQSDVLWGGDDECAGEGHALGDGEVRVACARGEVEDQVVEMGGTPVDLEEELLQGFCDH